MESVNYKSIEEANSLLNQDDYPSPNSKAPPSPPPPLSRSPNNHNYTEKGEKDSSSSLNAKSEEENNSKSMDCGLKKLVIIGALCREYTDLRQQRKKVELQIMTVKTIFLAMHKIKYIKTF